MIRKIASRLVRFTLGKNKIISKVGRRTKNDITGTKSKSPKKDHHHKEKKIKISKDKRKQVDINK